jgi:predicted nucleotidyltransferase
VALYTPEERDEVASRLLGHLREDERIASAELSGSGTAGYADRWSDVDVVVRSADGVDHSKLADDWSPRIYELLPVVHDFRVSFGEEHVRGFLLESFLEVDIGFQPRAGREDADGWVEWGPSPPAEAGFAWHDVLHASVAIRRGRPWRASYYIGLLRWRTIQLAAMHDGVDTGEFKGVDDLPSELLSALERALPESLAAGELERVLRVVTPLFFGQLRAFGDEDAELADRLEPRLLAFLDEPG